MQCPNCGGNSLYKTKTKFGPGFGQDVLPGLGQFMSPAKFSVVMCSQCGVMQFFAEEEARTKLSEAKSCTHWKKL